VRKESWLLGIAIARLMKRKHRPCPRLLLQQYLARTVAHNWVTRYERLQITVDGMHRVAQPALGLSLERLPNRSLLDARQSQDSELLS
jgi:hypothetical protein